MKLNVIFIICVFLTTFAHPQPKKFKTFFNIIKLKIFEVVDLSINGTECAADLKTFIKALHRLDWWALKMFDSSSKINSGLLQGNRRLFGDYGQCLSLQKHPNQSGVDGQYCTIPLTLNNNLRDFFYKHIFAISQQPQARRTIDANVFSKFTVLFYGVCLPKSCSVSNLSKIWSVLEKLYRPPFQAKFSTDLCYYKGQKNTKSVMDFYVFLFFSLVVTIVLASTGYDLYLRHKQEKPDFFVSFSLYTNTKRLWSTHCDNDSLTCLYGIKTISTIWIILGHITIFKGILATNSRTIVSEWMHDYKNSFFIAAPYNVDTFFSISGLLVVYVYLKMSEKRRISYFFLYLRRVLRLGPALIATIFINISIVKYLVEGPLRYSALKDLKTNCENSGWYSLFFASNFVIYEDRCLVHSWYLSVDTQLYLLVPLLLYGVKKNPKSTFIGGWILCMFSFAYTWTSVIRNNLGFTIFLEDHVDEIYSNPICRIPTWLIGTYFGYLLHKNNSKKTIIPKIANTVMWSLCICTFTILTLSQASILRDEYNVYSSAFFNTFSRPLWSLSVCYIIFSCSTGHAEVVRSFLSHPVFVILGKLTYSIYLIHLTLIHVVVANKTQVGYFSTSEILLDFWGYYVCILISATALCVVFESPVVAFLTQLKDGKWKKVKM